MDRRRPRPEVQRQEEPLPEGHTQGDRRAEGGDDLRYQECERRRDGLARGLAIAIRCGEYRSGL